MSQLITTLAQFPLHYLPLTMFFSAISALSFIHIAIASCAHGVEWVHPFSANVVPSTFSYGTTTGPLNWHNLNANNSLCGNGTNQSPILLNTTSSLAPSGSITLAVPPAKNVVFENLGTNVEVIMNGTLQAGNAAWNLAQFHFHTPSEHRVNFVHYESEMHFVFTAADGSAKITVLAFLIQIGPNTSYPFLEDIFSYLPSIPNAGQTTQVPTVDMGGFVSDANKMSYYQYTGSLTTPPCSEGVSWYVATTPIQLYVNTYRNVKNTIGTSNSRYTQNTLGQMNILQVAAKNL
ncbi:carbonic anhydrase [Athelia psychrophila]|uniref:Carbonic anhydrase n=1 Tax=Athelia psychrophila TaxID=1759441 RepID=A0A166LA54_9AGAM|nr:carbonic anhydrase [Fibularhizoctonia sp. CBS 109695]